MRHRVRQGELHIDKQGNLSWSLHDSYMVQHLDASLLFPTFEKPAVRLVRVDVLGPADEDSLQMLGPRSDTKVAP